MPDSPPMKICTPSARLRDVEQLHQAGALLEQVEQFAQAPHVGGQVLDVEQVALAGDDVLRRGCRRCAWLPASSAAAISSVMSSRSCRSSSCSAVADLLEIEAGEILVEVVGGLDQFGRLIGALGEQDAVLHVAVGGDDDQQDALFGQAEELDLADAAALRRGATTTPAKWVRLGQQLRGAG